MLKLKQALKSFQHTCTNKKSRALAIHLVQYADSLMEIPILRFSLREDVDQAFDYAIVDLNQENKDDDWLSKGTKNGGGIMMHNKHQKHHIVKVLRKYFIQCDGADWDAEMALDMSYKLVKLAKEVFKSGESSMDPLLRALEAAMDLDDE